MYVQTHVAVLTANGTWIAPNNLLGLPAAYAKGESGTAGTSSHGVRSGAGSGAGAIGGEPAWAGIVPGSVVTVTVPQGNTGNPTTLTATGAATIQANAGLAPAGTVGGLGGTAGTNTVAFAGGAGNNAISGTAADGGGGGGSAGSTGAGGSAAASTGGTAGPGAAGPPSLAGVAGQSGPGALNSGLNGIAPGGGASGGGGGGSINHLGGSGAPGQAVIIWQTLEQVPYSRGVPNARRGSSSSSRGAPVTGTAPTTPAPFAPPARAPRGQVARRGSSSSSRGAPISPTPAQFHVPPRSSRPGAKARRGSSSSSRGAPISPTPAPFHVPPRSSRPGAKARRGSSSSSRGAPVTAPPTPKQLLISLASAAGTDDYGNAYPQGIFASAGVIQGPTFVGSDYLSNAAGSFYYSGPAAFGNLISSVAPSAGTDDQGNAYLQGTASYLPGGTYSAVAITGGAVAWFTAPGAAGPWTEVGVMEIALTGGNPLVFSFSALGGNINIPQPAVFGLPLASPAPSSYNVVWGTQVVNAINNLYSMLQAAGISF